MSILNKNYIKSNITNNKDKSVSYRWTHGATDLDLGDGLLVYSIIQYMRAKVCVCLGSGGGFIPRIMSQARKDLYEQDFLQATQNGELVSDDIRNKFKKYSPQLAEASKSLRYPNDVSIANTSDFVIFNFYDYKPPFQERNSIGASLPYMTKNGKKVRYQDTTVTNFTLDPKFPIFIENLMPLTPTS